MVMIVNITKHADNRDLRITATEITMLLMDEIVVVSVMVGIRGGCGGCLSVVVHRGNVLAV